MDLNAVLELDTNPYPISGQDDWRYAYATARVRALETKILSKTVLQDMANAADYKTAIECLAGTDYTLSSQSSQADIEKALLQERSQVRSLFKELMVDEDLAKLIETRADFTNMRLAIRRVVTEREIGLDYSDEGSVPASVFEEVFEQENYSEFPDYLQEGVEAAVLGYYQNKDIKQIDYAIDQVQFETSLKKGVELKCDFLVNLTRIKIDVANMSSMLRLKFSESNERGPFFKHGFIKQDLFVHGLNIGYDGLSQLFYHTPYLHIIESGVPYLLKNGSFIKFESLCERYLWNCYKNAMMLTAGPSPVIAYLLMKEHEIRTVRMVLTSKKNYLPVSLILDRLGMSNE